MPKNHHPTKMVSKPWSTKSADHSALKKILMENPGVSSLAPKEVHANYGFLKAGYDLTSFRNALNKLKREVMLEQKRTASNGVLINEELPEEDFEG